MYARNSFDDTLGTSLPSIMPGGDDVTTLGGLNPAAPSEPDAAVRGSMGGASQLDVLLQKAKNSTRGSSLGADQSPRQSANLPSAEVPHSSHRPNTHQFANMTPASPSDQQKPPQVYNPPPVNTTVFAPSHSPPLLPPPQYQPAIPAPQPAQVPVALPVPQPVLVPQHVPDIPAHDGSIEEESARLQAQLAHQTGEMQKYLQTEMVRLSEAMKQTAAGVAAAAAAATVASPPPQPQPVLQPVQFPSQLQSPVSRPPVAQPVLYPSQPAQPPAQPSVQPPSAQLSMRQPASHPAAHARSTSPLRNPHQLPISQSPSFSSPQQQRPPAPTQFSPTGWVDVQRTAEMTEMAQKRVISPVWEGEKGLTPMGDVVVTPSNLNSAVSGAEAAANPRDSLASTSLPSIRCLNSTANGTIERAAPLNPPSASDATEVGEASELGEKLRKALSNVHEAPKAMEAAQALAAVDIERLIDVLHQFSPTLERKEVAITWKSLISRYVSAAGKFVADVAQRKGSKQDPKRTTYELDESLPPTPRSNEQSDFTLGPDGMGKTLQEVMSFIDKPLSPASLKRIETVRAKHDAKAVSPTQYPGLAAAAAYPIPFNMDPPVFNP